MLSAMALPHFARGEVVKGFGRGSKDLGIPTANFPKDVVDGLPPSIGTGVYFGFASVGGAPDVYKMVMSIGWNPFYKNEVKSMETHIMHEFDGDFYGKELRVAVLGYIRPERNFATLDELVSTIRADIEIAERALEEPEYARYKEHEFFKG